jgi:hypothetical protein
VDQQPSHGRQRTSVCGLWAKVLTAERMTAVATHDIEIFMVLTPFGACCEITWSAIEG